ncbi:MAG: hypothetical protein FJX72_15590, partial [Armatimonadetes bacterium]|nr:hypothetical protein [Armatimonadota bacterium]
MGPIGPIGPIVTPASRRQQRPVTRLGGPLAFEPNTGRYDKRVKFVTRTGRATVFITGSEAVILLRRQARGKGQAARRAANIPSPRLPGEGQGDGQWARGATNIPSPRLRGEGQGEGRRSLSALGSQLSAKHVLRMKLIGANGKAVASGLQKQPGIVNYLIGADPKQWRTHIPTYAKAKLAGVYPGVDVVYYGAEARGKLQEARGTTARPGPTMNRRSVTRIPPSRDSGQPTKVGFVSQTGDSSPGHGGALSAGRLSNLKSQISDRGLSAGRLSNLRSQISDRGLSALSPQLSALEYDFILKPHADPSRIQIAFEGAQKVRVADGDLILSTPAGDVRMKRPYAYQNIGGKRVQVACDYKLHSPLTPHHSPKVGLRLAKYDTARPLVVDPP